MTGNDITLERSGSVAILTIDDPAHRNALGHDAFVQMEQCCREVDEDQVLGAMIVRGAGGSFCSGALRSILEDTGSDPIREDNFTLLTSIYEAIARVGRVKVPVIAAVRGAAVGAGLNLALAADLRIVAEDARLTSGFLHIGIHPGGGHFELLRRAVGIEYAAGVAVFGETLTGTRAAEIGLAWQALPDDEVEPRALELANRVAGDPPLARAMKRSLAQADHGSWAAAIDAERSAQMWSLRRKHDADS